MKFIRAHVALLFVVIMSALCLWAAVVAFNITAIMIDRRDQVVKAVPAGQSELNKNRNNIFNISKSKEQTIILNGMKYEGIDGYVSEKEEHFIPLDSILIKLGIKLNYFDTDSILEWDYKGKKNCVKLGEDSLWLGKNKVSLETIITAAKNHILAPIDLFKYLDGYSFDKTARKNIVVLNSFPEYAKKLNTIKVLTQNSGNALITDVFGKDIIWDSKLEENSNDFVEKSNDGLKYLIKSGEKVYLLTSKNPTKPVEIAVTPLAHWSGTSKYLFWINPENKMLYIYNTESLTYRKIGDDYLKINGDDDEGNDKNFLLDYKRGSNYERISFASKAMEGNYTFIKRHGKVVIEGNLIFSPDKKKVVYNVKGEGYYFAYSDGTGKRFIGNANDIKWINDNKLFMTIDEKNYIVKNNGRTISITENDWRFLGKTQTDEVIFSINEDLYLEKDGEEREIMKLPWVCDKIYAKNAEGPYIAVVNSEDSIFLINKDYITRIETEKFKNQTAQTFENLNITYSSDGKHIGFFQEEDNLLSFNILNTDSNEQKRILLDFPIDNDADYGLITAKWISSNLVLVYSDSKWCSVNIDENIELYQQNMPKYNSLYGVLSR